MSDGPATHQVTELLLAHRDGDRGAFDRLLQHVYADLRRIARGQLRRHEATLGPTELVHESWFKLADEERAAWESRGHFFAIAARAMRQVLVDRARRRTAQKRGGEARPETLDEAHVASDDDGRRSAAVLALDDALRKLGEIEPRWVRVVECRFFAGLTAGETAEALEVSERTVGRDWVKARAILRQMLGARADALSA